MLNKKTLIVSIVSALVVFLGLLGQAFVDNNAQHSVQTAAYQEEVAELSRLLANQTEELEEAAKQEAACDARVDAKDAKIAKLKAEKTEQPTDAAAAVHKSFHRGAFASCMVIASYAEASPQEALTRCTLLIEAFIHGRLIDEYIPGFDPPPAQSLPQQGA